MMRCAYGKLQTDGKLLLYTMTNIKLEIGHLIVIEDLDGSRTTGVIQHILPSRINVIQRHEDLDPSNPDAIYEVWYPLEVRYER